VEQVVVADCEIEEMPRRNSRRILVFILSRARGILIRVEPNAAKSRKPDGLTGAVGVACTLPQNSPDSNCWSGVSPDTSTGFTPSPNGADPATSPLSYLQLKPTHGPRFHADIATVPSETGARLLSAKPAVSEHRCFNVLDRATILT